MAGNTKVRPRPAKPAQSQEKPARQAGEEVSGKAAKPSQLPVAFAYFLTLLISLVVFGFIGFYIINRFVLKEEQEPETSVVTDVPMAKDRFSVVYVQADEQNVMQHALLVRFIPDEGKIRMIPVPAELVCDDNGAAVQLKDVYSEKGVSAVRNLLEDVYGVEIDKYMTVTNGAFDGIVDYVGGITYTPTENMFYSDPLTGEELACKKGEKITLIHNQLRMYLNYPNFSAGKMENLKVQADLMEDFINDAFMQIEMLENNMDTLFNMVYNSSDTNMTKNEYISGKKGLLYIMKNYKNPCEALTPVGKWEDGSFTVSGSFPDEVKRFLEME